MGSSFSKNAFRHQPEIDGRKFPVTNSFCVRDKMMKDVTEEERECWQLQKEEVLLLMSVYCGEGECVVTYGPAHSETPPKEKLLLMDALCNMHEPPPPTNGDDVFHVDVKLQVQTGPEWNVDVLVQFYLPKLYPKSEVPVISISSDLVVQEDIAQLAKRANSHSMTPFPQPCLLDILAGIKDDVMRMRLCDPIARSQRANVQSTLATNQNINTVMPCQLLPHGKCRPLKYMSSHTGYALSGALRPELACATGASFSYYVEFRH